MKKLSRVFRHLFTTTLSARRAFPQATLKAIETAIADGETRHRAEVRMVVEPALEALAVLRGMTPRQRAKELFAQYGVWDTEENCGVLVYVNLADRQIEIVADRGVGRVIPAAEWQAVCRTMTEGFANGDKHDAVLAALTRLNQVLQRHYPDNGSRRNQLPDKPVML